MYSMCVYAYTYRYTYVCMPIYKYACFVPFASRPNTPDANEELELYFRELAASESSGLYIRI